MAPAIEGLKNPGIPLCPYCNPKDVHWSQTEDGKQKFLDIVNETFSFQFQQGGSIITKERYEE
jgi:hypothetical protein